MQNIDINKRVFSVLGVLQAFIGIGATGGGFILLLDPSGGILGVPISFLEGSPFADYFIPGLFLLTVNGFGSLVGAGLSLSRRHYAQEAAIILGVILIAWIVIQLLIIRSVSWLHVLYFLLGAVELGVGLYIKRSKVTFV